MRDIIQVKNLVKRYKKSDKNAVDDVSFSVKPGEFFALLGPNGAGKTTIISILTTTLAQTSGSVKIAGYDLESNANDIRANVGIIFQKPSLDLNLTAEENIRFHAVLYGLYPFRPGFRLMPKPYQNKVNQLAEVLGIGDVLQRPVRTFSGGMKRKLEILRSLTHDPKVLFLDEPTTGLDPESRRNLWDYLQNVRKHSKTTVFLTTHYLDEVEGADNVVIIDEGKIVEEGTPRSIKNKLVSEYVLLRPEKMDSLIKELDAKKLSYSLEGTGKKQQIKMNTEGINLHQFLRELKTDIAEITTHKPSLEEAYLKIISTKESEIN